MKSSVLFGNVVLKHFLGSLYVHLNTIRQRPILKIRWFISSEILFLKYFRFIGCLISLKWRAKSFLKPMNFICTLYLCRKSICTVKKLWSEREVCLNYLLTFCFSWDWRNLYYLNWSNEPQFKYVISLIQSVWQIWAS